MFALARTNTDDEQISHSELLRLIEREKVILRTNSRQRVLLHDFMCAVLNVDINDQINPHPAFAKIFGDYADVITNNFDAMRRASKTRGFFVPYSDLRGEIKLQLLEAFTSQVDEKIDQAKKTGKPAPMFSETYENPDFPPITEADFSPEARSKRIQAFLDVANVPAYPLGDLVQAMDLQSIYFCKISGLISRYEKIAIQRGEGHEVLAMWKRINALNTYGQDDQIGSGGGRVVRSRFSVGLGGANAGDRGWCPV